VSRMTASDPPFHPPEIEDEFWGETGTDFGRAGTKRRGQTHETERQGVSNDECNFSKITQWRARSFAVRGEAQIQQSVDDQSSSYS